MGEDVTLFPNKGNFNKWYKNAIYYQFKTSTLIKDEFAGRSQINASLTHYILDCIQIEESYKNN